MKQICLVKKSLGLIYFMLVTVFGFISQAYSASFIEPDRKIKQLFGWSIHGGRYSQGCVAVFAYSKDKSGFDRELWLGGEKTNTFTLRMDLDPDELAGSDMIEKYDSIHLPEFMFGGDRIGGEVDDYRGSVAILTSPLTKSQLNALKKARAFFYIEHGSEKIMFRIEKMSAVVDELNKCIISRR